jgi:hypothetical protein
MYVRAVSLMWIKMNSQMNVAAGDRFILPAARPAQ